tara:strand:- start:1408 stop:2511 length:1104 start_codon:yes stop_codon:yes gene_type:complete
MSTKKDKFTSEDHYYMNHAINLAAERNGFTGLNPSVGCVIVKNNKILSFGQTGLNGRPHAETVAIKGCKKEDLKGSTIYVTMEPCTHYGKTPPCSNLIVKSKIKRVIYSIEDVDIRTKKKAHSFLKSKKIIVSSGLLRDKTNKIYKKYFKHKNKEKPYIISKLACSKDYFTSSKKKFITNEYSRKVSHLFRYYCDAILVSSKTANADNSVLSCRLEGLGEYSPRRLIIDRALKIKKTSPIINDNRRKNTIIFHNSKDKKKINYIKSKGVKLSYVDLDASGRINLRKVFLKVYGLGISTIIVEGGKLLTRTLLKNKLINEFYLFKSNKILKKLGKNNIFNFKKEINHFFKKKENIKTFLNGEELIRYF